MYTYMYVCVCIYVYVRVCVSLCAPNTFGYLFALGIHAQLVYI